MYEVVIEKAKAHERNILEYKYKARHAHKRLYTVLPKYSKKPKFSLVSPVAD